MKQHFQDRTAGLHTWRFFAVEGYAGTGKRGFSSISIGLLKQYLADDRSLDLGVIDPLQAVAKQESGESVLVELHP